MEALIPFILFVLVWILLYKYLVNKKQKGKLISHLVSFIVATIIMFLSIIPIATKTASGEITQNIEEQKEQSSTNDSFKILLLHR